MIARKLILALGSVLLALSGCATVMPDRAKPTVRYSDGLWWNGTGFERGDRYVRAGIFVDASDDAEVIDLEGAYIVPPLVDAHVHDFDTAQLVAESHNTFLEDGIFTVLQMGGPISEMPAARAALQDSPLEVRFAGLSLTSPGGHPITYVEAQFLGVSWWSLSPEKQAEVRASRTREGISYFAPSNAKDLLAIWPQVLASQPDHLKIILWGDNGLSPELAIKATQLAHAAGIKVAAHVHDSDDVEVALRAGIDLLAHAPGYNEVTDLSEGLVARMAAASVAVVPTFARELAMEKWAPPSAQRDAAQVSALEASHAVQLRQFHSAGIHLLAGADLGGLTALDELGYWQKIGAFSGENLLRIATAGLPEGWRNGSRAPCLSSGCDASFVAIRDDPRKDIMSYRDAILRIRAGDYVTIVAK